jgi:hypothetical protein
MIIMMMMDTHTTAYHHPLKHHSRVKIPQARSRDLQMMSKMTSQRLKRNQRQKQNLLMMWMTETDDEDISE